VRHGAPGDFHAAVIGGPGSNDPTRVSIENYPLSSLVETAYNIRNYQLSGPDWLDEERFNIIARLPEGTTKEHYHLMMRNLLIDRFHLSAHFEQRQASGYRLVVVKGGPKLTPSPGEPKQSDGQAAPFKPTTDREGYPELPPGRTPVMVVSGRYDRVRWRFVDESMDRFAESLADHVHQPVLNATGLKGKYDFEAYWSYAAMRPDPPPDAGPSIFAALQEELGLKLQSDKIPVQTLIIDRIDKMPTEN
jgi:uncharacterized protein (TIGR03435 family)